MESRQVTGRVAPLIVASVPVAALTKFRSEPMRTSPLILAALALATACVPTPPAPAAPRAPDPVHASFGKTWDAVIDVFAAHDISIETLDRASGLIVPAARSLAAADKQTALSYADCGTAFRTALLPTSAHYNVVVRGDSAASTVLVRAFYTNGTGAAMTDCSSTGRFEDAMEEQIKARAEGK